MIGNELKSLGRQSFDPIVLKANSKKQNKNAKLNEEKKDNSEVKANPPNDKITDQTASTKNENNKSKANNDKTSTATASAAKKPAVARLSFELKSIRIMDEDAATNIAKGKKEYMIKVGDGKIAIIKK